MLLSHVLVSTFILAGMNTPVAPAPELGALIKSMIVENAKLTIEDRDGWGDQVRVFDRLVLRGSGLFRQKLRVEKKPVNHGLWKYYRLTVVDPDRDLFIRVPKLEYDPSSRILFTVEVLARLQGFADIKQYSNGIHIFSAATEGVFDVRMVIDGEVGLRLEPATWTPDLLLSPRVTSVRTEVPNIDIERFGKIRGKLAHETGDKFRKLIEDLVNDKDDKLAQSMNRQIQKKWDDGVLRLSLSDYLATKNVLPPSVASP